MNLSTQRQVFTWGANIRLTAVYVTWYRSLDQHCLPQRAQLQYALWRDKRWLLLPTASVWVHKKKKMQTPLTSPTVLAKVCSVVITSSSPFPRAKFCTDKRAESMKLRDGLNDRPSKHRVVNRTVFYRKHLWVQRISGFKAYFYLNCFFLN